MKQFSMNQKLLLPFIVALVALGVVIGGFIGLSPAGAAPGAIPTPAFTGYSGDTTQNVTFWNAQAMTVDAGSTAFELGQAEALDIQYIIDQDWAGGEPNTTTLKLQFSNDNTNWTDGVAVVTSNTTDTVNLLQYNNFGRYTRIYADVGASDGLTLTVIAVARR